MKITLLSNKLECLLTTRLYNLVMYLNLDKSLTLMEPNAVLHTLYGLIPQIIE
jgi:hypothetical protein